MIVYLGLGSNEGDRRSMLDRAVALLATRVGPVLACSSYIETEPWGFESPHPFLNAVVCLYTTLSPHRLLNVTQAIERCLGRQHKTVDDHYADRPIDIDILLIGQRVIRTARLTVPHPLMLQREFVWRPLLEIAPEVVEPVSGKPVASLVLSEEDTDATASEAGGRK